MRSRNNITPKNSTRAILAGKDNTLSASAKEFIILGDGNIVGDGKNIALIGSSGCIVGDGCENVTMINSSGCFVTAGIKNVSLINTFNQTIESGDTYFLNNAQQMPTAPSSTLSNVYEVTVDIPSADVLTSSSVPYLAIPDVGSGKFIRVLAVTAKSIFNTTPYATATFIDILSGTASAPMFIFDNLLASTDQRLWIGVEPNVGVYANHLNFSRTVYIKARGVDPTAGDSDMRFYFTYQILNE